MSAPRFAIAAGTVAVLAGLAVVVAATFEVTSDVTHFLPSAEDKRFAALSRGLAGAELSRTIILTMEAETTEQAVRAVRGLATLLEKHPETEWVVSGVDPSFGPAVFEHYFEHRYQLYSETPEQTIRELTSDVGLEHAVVELKRELVLPTGAAIKGLVSRDPLSAFVSLVRRMSERAAWNLDTRNGAFVTRDGRHAVLFLVTRHSAFATKAQRSLQRRIETAFDDLRLSDSSLVLRQSSVARFALRSERDIKRDIARISIVSTIGLILLFIGLFRSVRVLLLAMLPLVAGMLSATAVGLALFGKLHGITLAFGATLIGVCIDYPVHLFTHHALNPDPAGPFATLRRIWVAVVLGAATTVAGFAGLTWSSFPGIREVAVFAISGVVVALAATRWVLPALVGPPARIPRVLHNLDRVLQKGFSKVSSVRPARVVAAMAIGATLIGIGLAAVDWNDDIAALNRLDPELLAEDREVRKLVSRYESGRAIIVWGEDDEAALQRNDEVAERLARAHAVGQIGGFASLNTFLWSAEMQTRNLEAFRRAEDLPRRLVRVLEQSGFRAEAFQPFVESWDRDPRPLRYADLVDGPMGRWVRRFRFDVDGQVAIMSFVVGEARPGTLEAVVAGLNGVDVFDQREFMQRAYGGYRGRSLQLILVGLLAVLAVVLVRYRDLRLAAAAFLPAVLGGGTGLAVAGLACGELNLMHLIGFLLVLSIGLDYGVFVVESSAGNRQLEATVTSIAVACLSTLLAFGLLAMSQNPALRSLGVTIGVGAFACMLWAPTALLLTTRAR